MHRHAHVAFLLHMCADCLQTEVLQVCPLHPQPISPGPKRKKMKRRKAKKKKKLDTTGQKGGSPRLSGMTKKNQGIQKGRIKRRSIPKQWHMTTLFPKLPFILVKKGDQLV